MRLLAIFAHPDDESYGPGATLARYALTGHQVFLATMTRGEAGSLGICKELSPEEVAKMRTRELECAAKALHLSGLKIYDFPDKRLREYPAEKGIAAVRREIERLTPDVIITFHDKGISGHPDHVAVSHWCREAVRAFTPAPRLLFYGISPEVAEKVRPYRQVTPFAPEEITHVIDAGEYFEYKHRAIHCHQSQLDLWHLFERINREIDYFATREHFSQVIPPLQVEEPFTDLQQPQPMTGETSYAGNL